MTKALKEQIKNSSATMENMTEQLQTSEAKGKSWRSKPLCVTHLRMFSF
jgi:hypothetical protein